MSTPISNLLREELTGKPFVGDATTLDLIRAAADEIERLDAENNRLREHSRLVTNKLERKIVELEGEAKEAGEREVKAWAERDQYMRSNVELNAMVLALRAEVAALKVNSITFREV